MQADIFFFITSIAVIALTILLVIICILVVKILQRLREMADTVNDEVQLIKQDIDDLRAGVRDQLEVAERSPLTSFLASMVAHVRGTKPKKRTTRRKSNKK